MFYHLQPARWAQDAYHVDYEALWAEGVRGIIFDIDNTLVFHGAPADARSRALMRSLHELGFQTVILSNSTGRRARAFAAEVDCDVVTGAKKPLPGKFRVCMERMGTAKETTACIGDQLFTDILGANCAGVLSILTDPLDPKELFWVRMKRPFENRVRGRARQKAMDAGPGAGSVQ